MENSPKGQFFSLNSICPFIYTYQIDLLELLFLSQRSKISLYKKSCRRTWTWDSLWVILETIQNTFVKLLACGELFSRLNLYIPKYIVHYLLNIFSKSVHVNLFWVYFIFFIVLAILRETLHNVIFGLELVNASELKLTQGQNFLKSHMQIFF